jgi:hypothetical protein
MQNRKAKFFVLWATQKWQNLINLEFWKIYILGFTLLSFLCSLECKIYKIDILHVSRIKVGYIRIFFNNNGITRTRRQKSTLELSMSKLDRNNKKNGRRLHKKTSLASKRASSKGSAERPPGIKSPITRVDSRPIWPHKPSDFRTRHIKKGNPINKKNSLLVSVQVLDIAWGAPVTPLAASPVAAAAAGRSSGGDLL